MAIAKKAVEGTGPLIIHSPRRVELSFFVQILGLSSLPWSSTEDRATTLTDRSVSLRFVRLLGACRALYTRNSVSNDDPSSALTNLRSQHP